MTADLINFVQDFVTVYQNQVKPELIKDSINPAVTVLTNTLALKFATYENEFCGVNSPAFAQYKLAVFYLGNLGEKLEKGELIPEDEVRKKLEKTLNISLLDEGTSEPADLRHARMTTTMGDVIQIKKAKK
jgi:hypothetical protein